MGKNGLPRSNRGPGQEWLTLEQERREVDEVVDRLYERTDLQSRAPWKFISGVILIWFVCVGLNSLVFSTPLKSENPSQEKTRLRLSVGYGPFFPLLDIATKQRAGEKLFGKVAVEKVAIVPMLLPLFLIVGGLASSLFNVEGATWKRKAKKHAKKQGRYGLDVMRSKLALRGSGVPLGLIHKGEQIGIPYGTDAGHVLVLAPSRRGKGMHLTETLLAWHGPAVVLDPKFVGQKFEQWERTAGFRDQHGQVYRVGPQSPHSVDLLDYFDPNDPFDLQELHRHLLRPWMDRDPIFAEKCLALFEAARDVAKATKGHMLKILAEWTNMPAIDALAAAAEYAPGPVAKFADGLSLESDERGRRPELSRFASSAWGTFSTRFYTVPLCQDSKMTRFKVELSPSLLDKRTNVCI